MQPLGRYRLFYLKVLKICLIQEIIHFSVFLYQYIILLASLIYFWRGSRNPKGPPGSAPAIYTVLYFPYSMHTCYSMENTLQPFL